VSCSISLFRSLSLLASLLVAEAACGGAAAEAPDAPAAAASAPAPGAASTSASASAPAAPAAPEKEERFDLVVRDDFFAGLLEQDTAALARAMKVCEERLARDPKHAEAMVWHGGGLVMRAGNAFRAGDRASGGKLWEQGMAEMDRAVELEPENVGTRIPRGAVLLAAAPFVPEPTRATLLDKGLGDYEKVLELQAAEFDQLSRHARSQLLYGLADGWQRRGDQVKARAYYERLKEAGGDSAYGKRAREWLAGDTKPRQMTCGGCHSDRSPGMSLPAAHQ
jgi:tetratricopeptide (TPR) repeat protein